jgi:tetratricopeptide (TPR) repeat protein
MRVARLIIPLILIWAQITASANVEISQDLANWCNFSANNISLISKYADNIIKTGNDTSKAEACDCEGFAKFNLGLYEEANDSFNMALEINRGNKITNHINDTNYVAWRGIGDVQSPINQTKSLEAYDKALSIKNNTEIWLRKGSVFDIQKDYSGSVKSYAIVVNKSPGFDEGWWRLGIALLNLNEYEEARDACKEAIKLNNNSAEAYLALGTIYMKLEQYDNATFALLIATQLSRTNKTKLTSLTVLSNAYLNNNRPDEAINAALAALDINNESKDAQLVLANAYLQKNDPQKAIEILRMYPMDKKTWDGLANAYYQSNDPKWAIYQAVGMDMGLSKEKSKYIVLEVSVYLILLIIVFSATYRKKVPIALSVISMNFLGFLAASWFAAELLKGLNLTILLISFWTMIVIIIGGLWVVLGGVATPWRIRVAWAFIEFDKNILGTFRRIDILILFLGALYAISCVILFIMIYDIPSLENIYIIWAVGSVTLIVISIFFPALTVVPVIRLLKSGDIDQDTRDIVLVTQFGYLSVNAFYLSITLWFLGIGNGTPNNLIPLVSVSPQFIAISIILLAFLMLFPYFYGCQKGKKWRELLLSMERDWFNRVLDILEFPTPLKYTSKLESLYEELNENRKEFEIHHLPAFDCSDNDWKEKRLECIFSEDIKHLDPSYDYRDFIKRLSEKIHESTDELSCDDPVEKISIANKYAEAYRSRRDELSDQMKEVRQTKPQLLVYLTVLVGPLAMSILDFTRQRLVEGFPLIISQVIDIAGITNNYFR